MKFSCMILMLCAFAAQAADDLHVSGENGLQLEYLTSSTKQLQDRRLYVVTNSLTFTGTNAEDGKTGGNGLSVAANATAYLYLSPDATLTCCGGKGGAAGAGKEASRPAVRNANSTDNGITTSRRLYAIATAGGGGLGAGGGGAGIFVPSGAKLRIFGSGTLVATGGAGGAGGNGGDGSQEHWLVSAWCGTNNAAPTHTSCSTSDSASTRAGTVMNAPFSGMARLYVDGQPGAGGGGGGGAGGGGAAIGTPGAAGSSGTTGGVCGGRWNAGNTTDTPGDPSGPGIARVAASVASSASTATSAGDVRIDLKNVTLTAGEGGAKGTNVAAKAVNEVTATYYTTGSGKTGEEKLYFTRGQAGGGGGAGGKAVAVGSGGQGGKGGQGGDSGSVVDSFCGKATAPLSPLSAVGTSGTAGAAGQGVTTNWIVSLDPYNTVTCTGSGQSAATYKFSRTQSVTLASGAADGILCGWQVSQGARRAAGDNPMSSSLLSGDANRYDGSAVVTLDRAAYGDVALTASYPRVTLAGGTKAPIRVRTDSDFYAAQLLGKTLEQSEAFLDGSTNGIPHWQSYVANLAIGAHPVLSLAVTNGTVGLKPLAYAPHRDAGFEVGCRYRSTNELVTATWPVVGTGATSDGAWSEPVGGRTNAFYRMEITFESNK